MQNFCIHCDWLSIHVEMGVKFNLFNNENYKIEILSQTKVFKKIYGIRDKNGVEIANLSCEANDTILPKNHCILKIANNRLYCEYDVTQFVKEFMNSVGLIYHSVCRFDIAYDFQKFENDLDPNEFMRMFSVGDIVRAKTASYQINFEQIKGRNIYSGITIGKHSSEVRSILYNKTKEMNEVKNKPYIREIHNQVFKNEKDVYRLEFSISSFKRSYSDYYKKDNVDNSLDALDDLQMYGIFIGLVKKKFNFRINNGGRTARMKDFELFEFIEDSEYLEKEIVRPSLELKNSNNSEKNVIRKLSEHFVEYEKKNKEYSNACLYSLNQMINIYGLRYWAITKDIAGYNMNIIDEIEVQKKPVQKINYEQGKMNFINAE